MSFLIEFVPANPELFSGKDDLLPIAEAIYKEINRRKFYQPYVKSVISQCNNSSFTVNFKGMCFSSNLSKNHPIIVREMLALLVELGLDRLIVITQTMINPEQGDNILPEDYFKSGQTRNALLFSKYNISDEEAPDEFLCAITKELIDTPAYISNRPDIKYEYKNITFWLYQHGATINPHTKTEVHVRDIVIDYELKNKINDYVQNKIEEKLKLNKIQKEFSKDSKELWSFGKILRTMATNNASQIEFIVQARCCNINEQDAGPTHNRTALHWAVIKGSNKAALCLLKAGAKYKVPDKHGKTAWQYAKENNNQTVLSEINLIEGKLAQSNCNNNASASPVVFKNLWSESGEGESKLFPDQNINYLC